MMQRTEAGPMHATASVSRARDERWAFRDFADSALGPVHFKVVGRGRALLICHQVPSSPRQHARAVSARYVATNRSWRMRGLLDWSSQPSDRRAARSAILPIAAHSAGRYHRKGREPEVPGTSASAQEPPEKWRERRSCASARPDAAPNRGPGSAAPTRAQRFAI